MRTHVADPAPRQIIHVDEMKHFRNIGDNRLRKIAKSTQSLAAISKITKRQFAQHVWVHQNPAVR